MKLLEIINMMDIKEHYQVWSLSILIKTVSGTSVNELLAVELYKPVIKKNQKKKSLCHT